MTLIGFITAFIFWLAFMEGLALIMFDQSIIKVIREKIKEHKSQDHA